MRRTGITGKGRGSHDQESQVSAERLRKGGGRLQDTRAPRCQVDTTWDDDHNYL